MVVRLETRFFLGFLRIENGEGSLVFLRHSSVLRIGSQALTRAFDNRFFSVLCFFLLINANLFC